MAIGFTSVKVDEKFHSGCERKRDCFDEVFDYVMSDGVQTKVCALYGLRRTGKSTVMKQCAESLPDELKKKAFYIECTMDSDTYDVFEFIQNAIREGYVYFFIDEITATENFQRIGELLSDVYVGMNGARIVLSGTDSLALSLIARSNMFGRIQFVSTTYASFAEYSRITGCQSVDEYIQLGCTMEPEHFLNHENMSKYVNTAIVENIIHSLEKSEGISRYPAALTELYEADLLRSSIQRIINAFSQELAYAALTRGFRSAILGNALEVAAKDRLDPNPGIARLIDKNGFNEGLSERLGVVPYDPKKTQLSESHFKALRKFLRDIDVWMSIPEVDIIDGALENRKIEMLSHPGMFHANLSFVFELLKSDKYWLLGASQGVREKVHQKAAEWALGAITENCVLADVCHMLCGHREVQKEDSFGSYTGRWFVSKLRYEGDEGPEEDKHPRKREADVIIFDKETKDTYLFEVKHSLEYAAEQSKHLESEDFLRQVRKHFGPIKGRAVLYNGETDDSYAVPRISIKEFLLQMYEDIILEDFSPDKTMLALCLDNIGGVDDVFFHPLTDELISDSKSRFATSGKGHDDGLMEEKGDGPKGL